MKIFYQTSSWSGQPQAEVNEETINLWKNLSDKKNWRITQLPNGYFQSEHQDIDNKDTWHDVTRRETIEGAEQAIDGSVEHYVRKLDYLKGPTAVKTF